MATACGPGPVPRDSPLFTMDDVASETLTVAAAPSLLDKPQRATPPPNPTFSFPPRDSSPTDTSSGTRPARRRPLSAIEGTSPAYKLAAERTEARVALPQFSFNPGASLPPDPTAERLSPSLSPQSPRLAPSGKPVKHGHRRGGSEFVGGRLREGSSIAVISGSPTKDESGLASPSIQPRRRGHRRGVSSALSTNDLSLPQPRHSFSLSGSAPNSPTSLDLNVLGMPLAESLQPPESGPKEAHGQDNNHPSSEPVAEEGNINVPPKRASKVKVGFSDTLEYIPRPLSLVSTDTSSTITAKPTHATSGSISSITTGVGATGRESPAFTSRSPTSSADASRPSTAGAILERTPTFQAEEPDVSPRRRNSIPALLDLVESSSVSPPTPSPTKAKRWTFFGLDPFSTHPSPGKTRPQSACSVESATRVVSTGSSSDHGSESAGDSRDGKIQGKKKSKRRKIVKGWADSILPRIPKHHCHKASKYAVRPPTPPAAEMPPEEDEEEAAEVSNAPPPAPPTVTITESPSPPRPIPRADEISSPMIDLDAALGPFNTPLPNNPEWDAAQRAAGSAGRRRLHSAQGMRGFSGPGMHYHRRAESAPDLPPFEMGKSAMNRFASSSTMADVFEEEEEEQGDGESSQYSKQTPSGPPSNADQDSDGDTTPPAVPPEVTKEPPWIMSRRRSSGLSDKDQASLQSVRAQLSRASLHENVFPEGPNSVRLHPRSAGSDVSPKQSPRKVPGSRERPPTFELGPPRTPYTMTPISPHSASFASSPRSPMSADTQRLSTSPSSVNEDHSFHSLLMGEPGPEVRLSVDYDIPSLTSSNSTTTRDSNFPPHARMSQPRLREPRPLSVSSAAFGRRRSSLASLSRLISSSHGERSKLSMEVTLNNEAENKKPQSKTKRLGRLVQFWKPKESTAS